MSDKGLGLFLCLVGVALACAGELLHASTIGAVCWIIATVALIAGALLVNSTYKPGDSL